MPETVQIACMIEPSFGENAYVVWRRAAGPCWIIDPGLPPSAARIAAHIGRLELKPDAIVLTHGHADHIAGIPEVLRSYPNLPIYISDEERACLTDPRENLSADLGTPFKVEPGQTRSLDPGSQLSLDETTWHVLDVSGHSPGGCALYCPVAGLVIVGDALFQGSIGRTDFHHSSHDRLIRNIKERLFALPDQTRVYSGHGPATTIGSERRTNPFLQ